MFGNVIAKESKPRGYYDNKYWSQVKVSQGLAFVGQSANEVNHSEIKGVQNKMEHMSDKVDRIHAFLERMFPGECWVNEMVASQNDVVNEMVAPQNDVVSTWAFSFLLS